VRLTSISRIVALKTGLSETDLTGGLDETIGPLLSHSVRKRNCQFSVNSPAA
jgi:hypothetical protein